MKAAKGDEVEISTTWSGWVTGLVGSLGATLSLAFAQEVWTRAPEKEWPHVALINEIEYTDKHYPIAGSAFLLDTGSDTLAVTAKHVLTYFRSKSMKTVSFNNTLKSWKMYPKDSRDDVTVVERLVNEDADESIDGVPCHRDWLLFTIERMSQNVRPLKLRKSALEPGEQVFVVGWRYTDRGAQRIYKGEYVRSEKGSILISVEELADNTVPGLSGSPVLDSQGDVIGLMSKKAGRMQRASAIDYPKAVLKERSSKRTSGG